MIKWLKKKLLKSIVKDITKQLPKYREMALIYIDEHKDEVLEKVKEAIKNIVEERYLKKFPNLRGKYSAHICESADGVNLDL
jgi:predicted ATP-dependent Lon-type protease